MLEVFIVRGKKVRISVWLGSVKGTENRREAVRDRERPR